VGVILSEELLCIERNSSIFRTHFPRLIITLFLFSYPNHKQVKVGDCFRLGSVGLVVSEMRADGEVEQRIDAKTLEFLKDEALAFDTNGDLATLAADEERLGE